MSGSSYPTSDASRLYRAPTTGAGQKDPITFPPALPGTIIEIEIPLESFEGDVPQGVGSYHSEFLFPFLSMSPLYELDITGHGGNTPSADFTISSILVSQGWDEASVFR